MLRKYANEMMRIVRSTERRVEEEAPAFRSTQSEVEKLVDAMLTNSKVQTKLRGVVGKDGDVEGLVAELYQAFPVVIASCVQKVGGKVGGTSASVIKTSLRNLSQGEDAPLPPKPEL